VIQEARLERTDLLVAEIDLDGWHRELRTRSPAVAYTSYSERRDRSSAYGRPYRKSPSFRAEWLAGSGRAPPATRRVPALPTRQNGRKGRRRPTTYLVWARLSG
jgi:hypothetical protein